jgi:competence protein ComEC
MDRRRPAEGNATQGGESGPGAPALADASLATRIVGSMPLAARPGPATRLALRMRDAVPASIEAIGREAGREREAGGLYNMAPAVFSLGILAYFAAPAEPLLPASLLPAIALALIAVTRRERGAGFIAAAALALFLAGMAAAQIKGRVSGAADFPARISGVVDGVVILADRNSRGGPRYLLRPLAIEGLKHMPTRVRVSVAPGGPQARPGDIVRLKASLSRLSGPAYPGGYDFSFASWHDGLSAVGFSQGRAQILQDVDAASGLRERFEIAVNRVREAVAGRIRAGLPGEAGDVTVALVTGDRSGLYAATVESLRRSGLAHVLAISGLHMALVSLTVMAAVRWTLAWFPSVALHHPVKKWGAAAALASATAYLFLSGMSVSTQRSFAMICVMLAAVLLDRRALTIRNVATAALIVLAFSPEALLEPGFQMSFAAAASLVAAYEAWTAWKARGRRGEPAVPGLPMRVFGGIAAIAFTTIVAGTATGIFAAWHFHRVAMLGTLANVAAMPLITIAVMPLALISCLLMPYGAESLALAPLGLSIEAVIAISDRVNELGPDMVTGALAAPLLPLSAAGLVALTMLRSRLRLVGAAMLLALPLAWRPVAAPDVIIAENGRAAAVLDADGRLAPLWPRRERFTQDIWMRAYSGGVEGDIAPMKGLCDADSCEAVLPSGKRLTIVYAPVRIEAACASADILAAPRLWWVDCRGERKPELVLRRADFENGGSIAIHLEASGADGTAPRWRTQTSRQAGIRPWQPQVAAPPESRFAPSPGIAAPTDEAAPDQ